MGNIGIYVEDDDFNKLRAAIAELDERLAKVHKLRAAIAELDERLAKVQSAVNGYTGAYDNDGYILFDECVSALRGWKRWES